MHNFAVCIFSQLANSGEAAHSDPSGGLAGTCAHACRPVACSESARDCMLTTSVSVSLPRPSARGVHPCSAAVRKLHAVTGRWAWLGDALGWQTHCPAHPRIASSFGKLHRLEDQRISLAPCVHGTEEALVGQLPQNRWPRPHQQRLVRRASSRQSGHRSRQSP